VIRPEDRPKATLAAVIRFARARDHWPDAIELRTFHRALGCRATIQASLSALRDNGLLELRGWSAGARWVATAEGFALLRKPVFTPTSERTRTRRDAATILEDHPGRRATQTLPSPRVATAGLLRAPFVATLDVFE
jgi:hypothetical protein